jgi:hypothetical protein
MKRTLIICLSALMLMASLAGCRNGSTASPSPIVSTAPSAVPSNNVSPSPDGSTAKPDGILEDAGDALQDAGQGVENAVDDLLEPSATVSPRGRINNDR